MAYIAQKPCHLAGQAFFIGDIVPDEVIHPGNAKNLLKMGIIALQGGDPVEAATGTIETPERIIVVLHGEEGDLPLGLTPEDLQAVFDVLTTNVSEAETIINGITDQDALIALHAADSRKSVRELAKARATELITVPENEESAGEQ